MTVPSMPRPSMVSTAPARGRSSAFSDQLDLARQADVMAASVPARPIPIRIVPRAALEALVARLVASGSVEPAALATGAP